MVTVLTLIVLRCSTLSASKAFYEAVGLRFQRERHGSGPEHWSCSIGETVLELYPTGRHPPFAGRLGFRVDDLERTVGDVLAIGGRLERPLAEGVTSCIVIDPDGNKVELTSLAAS